MFGKLMKKVLYFWSGIGLVGVMIFILSIPVNAAPHQQLPTPFLTPTPLPDGRILYTVQEDDTLWRIASVAGISLPELRRLNNIPENVSIVIPGQVLLLGLAGPGEVTPEPGDTPAEGAIAPLTPTPLQNSGEICVLLYADMNGDSIRQEVEMGIPGGEVSVTEQQGAYSDKASTKAGDPEAEDPAQNALTCFEDIPVGGYNVTLAIPEGFNPTTVLTVAIELTPGDTSYMNFGAQLTSQASSQETGGTADGGRSPILGILGVTLLLVGLVLGIYSTFMGRQRRGGGETD